MTTIRVHGLLGQEFGEEFSFSISRARDVFRALDCLFDNFTKRVVDLAKDGLHYSIVVNNETISCENDLCVFKKIETIDIVPVIVGSGPVAFLAVGLLSLGGAAALGTTTFLGSLLLSVAFAAISFGIQGLLAKPPKANAISETSTSATSKSFLFSNRENVAGQGSPVPLGYGRLRIGSAIIQENVKSYPNSVSTFDEFASQSTQQGGPFMSVINNQEL